MVFSFTDLLLCFLCFQLLFVSGFLFTLNRGKWVSNALLGGFFLVFGLNLLDTLLLLKGFYVRYPGASLWATNLALLFGPLLYGYTQSIVYRDFHLRPIHLLHTLPFILLTAAGLLIFHRQSAEEQQRILRSIGSQPLPGQFYVASTLIVGHFLVYLLLSLRLVRRYRLALTNRFSTMQDKNLRWLEATLVFFLVVLILSIVRSFLGYTPFAAYESLVLVGLLVVLLWFINRFLLQALRTPTLFAGVTADELAVAPPSAPEPAVNHEPLLRQLTDYMQTQQPYLEPELALDDLARQLDVRSKVLSAALNEGLGQHFFDYVNQYRIEEAKRLLATSTDPKITVLEIMYRVGFNSKSSFNTLFRKYTGQTPSAFKKDNQPV